MLLKIFLEEKEGGRWNKMKYHYIFRILWNLFFMLTKRNKTNFMGSLYIFSLLSPPDFSVTHCKNTHNDSFNCFYRRCLKNLCQTGQAFNLAITMLVGNLTSCILVPGLNSSLWYSQKAAANDLNKWNLTSMLETLIRLPAPSVWRVNQQMKAFSIYLSVSVSFSLLSAAFSQTNK